jgi:hypothetical protein
VVFASAVFVLCPHINSVNRGMPVSVFENVIFYFFGIEPEVPRFQPDPKIVPGSKPPIINGFVPIIQPQTATPARLTTPASFTTPAPTPFSITSPFTTPVPPTFVSTTLAPVPQRYISQVLFIIK